MFIALKKILQAIEQAVTQAQYQDMEQYLSQSQSPADLESRMRRWELAQARNGRFHLS